MTRPERPLGVAEQESGTHAGRGVNETDRGPATPNGTAQLLRRAVFRYDVTEWHRGVDVRIYDPHWDGYEPISVRVLGNPDQPLNGEVDVEVWFRRLS